MVYRLRFWYWHQEVVIDDIKPEELIGSVFFPNSCGDHPDFIRDTYVIDHYNPGEKKYPIEVSLSEDAEKLFICHLDENDPDKVDTRYANNGYAKLDSNYWTLEYSENGFNRIQSND